MHNHFDRFLNLKEIIFNLKPKTILECGALNGELTNKLISLSNILNFYLTVISDDADISFPLNSVTYIRGISYIEIPNLQDRSIDLAIIDTDHNYWTLNHELTCLHPKLKPGSLVALHDVDEFYYNTGVADGYGVDHKYPIESIEETGNKYGSIGTCLMDFLSQNKFSYKLISWTNKSNGAALIERQPDEYPVLFFKALEGKGKRTIKC